MKEPCAYEAVTDTGVRCLSLEKHLVRTAYIAHELFKKRVEINGGPLGFLNKTIHISKQKTSTLILVLAALLHDIGKTSTIYTLNKEKGYVTYPLHEHASAHLVGLQVQDLYDREDMDCAWSLQLVAAVIARHHTAMQCRHPDEMLGSRCIWHRNQLRRVVAGITRSRVSEALPGRLRALTGSLGLLRDGEPSNIDSTLQLTQSSSMTTYYVDHRIKHARGVKPVTWLLPSIQALSGALIVSDILVAWRERCGEKSCEEPDKAYARSWISELGAARLLEDVVNRPIEDLIEPISRVLEEWESACNG